MKISNALWEININYHEVIGEPFTDRSTAINTALKSLTEWQALLDEADEMSERDDLRKWIKKHIARIEGD